VTAQGCGSGPHWRNSWGMAAATTAARRQVQAAADTLLNRSTTLVQFDENLASAGPWIERRLICIIQLVQLWIV